MTNQTPESVIAEARKLLEDYPNYQEYPGGPLLKYPHQDALLKATHALEASEARVKELEAGRWEYAQAVITDDEGGLYLGKSFGDDPTRALDEGYVLVRRHVGPWVPVESDGE